MYFDLAELSPNQAYFTMTQTIVPRPVAWVLSENTSGDFNLAPFSYFNAVCSDPPLVMLSIGRKPDGSPKDTRVNIEQRGHFVIHIAHREQAKPMTESSATLDYGDSEVARLGLQTVPFQGFTLPRLTGCRIFEVARPYQTEQLRILRTDDV